MLLYILIFLTFVSQIIANIFEGEWSVILFLTFLVFLCFVALMVGLLISLWRGINGITRGMTCVVLALVIERLYLLVAQSYIIRGEDVATLADWRLGTLVIILGAIGYNIFEVIRHVIHQAHSNNST